MSFASRKNWDLTHLASKYPWLRVDSETIEEFRSPFQWVDIASQTQPQRIRNDEQHREGGSEEEDDESGGDGDGSSGDDERKESVRYSLSGRHVTESTTKTTTSSSSSKKKYGTHRWKKQNNRLHVATTKKAPPRKQKCKSGQELSSVGKRDLIVKRNDRRLFSSTHAEQERPDARGIKDASPRVDAAERMPSVQSDLKHRVPRSSPFAALLQDPALLYETIGSPAIEKKRSEKKRLHERKKHDILSLRFVAAALRLVFCMTG